MTENQKKIFSLATAAILTLIIVVIWSSSPAGSASGQVTVEKTDKLSSLSPIQVIKDEFSKAFSSFNDKTAALQGTTTQGTSTIPIEILEAHSTSSGQATTTN